MTFYRLVKGLAATIMKTLYKIEVVGIENIPLEGRAILCANHFSNWDPILVAIVVPRQVFFMAKKQLFNIKTVSHVVKKLGAFPVDRDGADLSAVRNSLKILKDGGLLGMFPEGTRTKDEKTDNAKPGIAMIGIKGKSPVIPIYISSSYKIFSKIKIVIGEQIQLDEHYNKKGSVEDYRIISQRIMDSIFNLKLRV